MSYSWSKAIFEKCFCLAELFEQRIGSEIKNSHGSKMYDGWFLNDTHFAAALASYCTATKMEIDLSLKGYRELQY